MIQIEIKPSSLFRIINIIFDIDKKVVKSANSESLQRPLSRLKELFSDDFNLSYHDPTGEPFSETRTDVEARIAGESADDLIIVETLKPIIRYKKNEITSIVQKGVVTVAKNQNQK
jgi:hypothetical protein